MAPRPEAVTTRTIQDLVRGLCGIPAPSFTRDGVLDEIGRTVLDPASLRPFLYFRRSHYTRNLIHRNDLFEVVAIGWEPGQVSAIHNHRGQECWMGVPIGRLEVRNYRLIRKNPEARTCLIEPSVRYAMDPRHPAAVDPNEPIHSVHNLEEFGSRAVSVHVYSRPFDSCEIYQPEKGCYYDVPLGYTSRFGVLCPGEGAELALTIAS
ncbi:MAG TPA: cysteine dioxygenase family protein [Candidatus Polarisedimenticolia bacterium]|jgi:cysteine dioxygenase|nr:cysteine dioxygenase family protein [Candidatus Polarisedimenticolia bacterium]